MLHYRAYLLDQRGRIHRAVDLECRDDAEAFGVAARHQHGQPVELWQGARLVGRIDVSNDARAVSAPPVSA